MFEATALALALSLADGAEAGAIDCRVFDVHGQRLPNAEVSLLAGAKTVATKASDADGRLVFERVPYGSYRLLVHMQGFSRAERQVTVRGGGRQAIDVWLKLYKITPMGPWRLSGTVRDSRGALVDGASVSAIALFEPDKTLLVRTEQGAFGFQIEEAGAYMLVTQDGMKNCPDARLVIVDGYLTPIEIEMGSVSTNADGHFVCERK